MGTLILILWGFVICFTVPHLGVILDSNPTDSDLPVFLKVLGESKSILSSFSILQADLYYHNGVMDKDHRYVEKKKGSVKSINFLPKIEQALKITDHVHLTEDQTKEIVPWLFYSTRVDPNNIQGYTLTAYYLAYKFNKAEDAINLLREGVKNNPESWEIYSEIGGIYFKLYKNYVLSEVYFDKGWKLLKRTKYDKLEARHVLTLLAFSNEQIGNNERALQSYKKLQELFPKSDYYQERILDLEGNILK